MAREKRDAWEIIDDERGAWAMGSDDNTPEGGRLPSTTADEKTVKEALKAFQKKKPLIRRLSRVSGSRALSLVEVASKRETNPELESVRDTSQKRRRA